MTTPTPAGEPVEGEPDESVLRRSTTEGRQISEVAAAYKPVARRTDSIRLQRFGFTTVEDPTDAESTKDHRLTVVFAHPTYRVLEALAEKKGKSKADILRDGVRLAEYFDTVMDDGGHILVERNGTTREIVIT